MSSKNNVRTRRCLPLVNTTETSSPIIMIHCAGRCGRNRDRNTAAEVVVAAVVVTVIVGVVVFGVPFAVIVDGENVHAASVGRPEQLRLIVPLNPVELETPTAPVPTPPGAEINIVDCAAGTAA